VNTHFYAESYTRGETALAVKLPAVKGSAAKDPHTHCLSPSFYMKKYWLKLI
jgi:hypothetical protein